MKRNAKHILIALTLILLFLPMAQEHLRLFDFRKLSGVVSEKPKPPVELKSITDNSLQQWCETYLRLHYGLREPLTRIYNQYCWDLFKQSNSLGNKRNYISDDGWIYEGTCVEEFYRGRFPASDSAAMIRNFGEEALRLKQIQQILESQNTHLFVLLLPGKEQVYPEHIPVTYDFPGSKPFSVRDFYAERFKELGVNHIDIGQWFLNIKDTVDYPLYPQTGTHWSNYAAMHVADSLIRYMEWLGDIKMEHFTIGERTERTVEPDDDLEQLMNLIRPLPKAPNYYAPYTIIDDSTAARPTLITIGDSYYWNLLNATPFGKVMGDFKYWYYFNTVYFDEGHSLVDDLDVMKEVLDADFVMVAYSPSQLYKMSQGFSQKVLLDLCCNKEDLDAAQQELTKAIKTNPVWVNSIIQRTEQYEIPIDTAIIIEARNGILKSPNRFVPALKDSVPTARSERFMALTHHAEPQNDSQPQSNPIPSDSTVSAPRLQQGSN